MIVDAMHVRYVWVGFDRGGVIWPATLLYPSPPLAIRYRDLSRRKLRQREVKKSLAKRRKSRARGRVHRS
jgi:hypothetical protein